MAVAGAPRARRLPRPWALILALATTSALCADSARPLDEEGPLMGRVSELERQVRQMTEILSARDAPTVLETRVNAADVVQAVSALAASSAPDTSQPSIVIKTDGSARTSTGDAAPSDVGSNPTRAAVPSANASGSIGSSNSSPSDSSSSDSSSDSDAPGTVTGAAVTQQLRIVTGMWHTPKAAYPGLCRSLGSMLYMGYNVTLLTGEWLFARPNVSETAVKDMQTMKIVANREWLRQRKERLRQQQLSHKDEVVLLLDAYDVILQRPPSAALAAVAAIANASHPVVASSEKGCFPALPAECEKAPLPPYEELYKGLPVRRPKLDWFPHWMQGEDHAPRWLNSGCMGGSGAGFLDLIESFTDEELKRDNDQRIYLMRFMGGNSPINLDYASQLCHSTINSDKELVKGVDADGSTVFRNNITGAVPVVLHYNGASKFYYKVRDVWRDLAMEKLINKDVKPPGNLYSGDEKPVDYWSICEPSMLKVGMWPS